ncbi:MAG: FlgB family protein [Pseudomonadota bacterium]
MLTSLEIFQSAQAMARHAASQQSVVARNIANADTPGFKAMMVPERDTTATALPMKSGRDLARSDHIAIAGSATAAAPIKDPNAITAPNGNSVSVEMEILKSIEAERAHSRAMTVYQSALTILKASIGRGR